MLAARDALASNDDDDDEEVDDGDAVAAADKAVDDTARGNGDGAPSIVGVARTKPLSAMALSSA